MSSLTSADTRGVALPKVVYISADGTQHAVDAAAGQSVMQAAVSNGVPGIIGECGGNLSCATCHVWVRDEFAGMVGEPRDLEDDMLDLAVDERRAGSRLGCQIAMTEELDGLTVDVPPQEG
jgi:ferredoxin, 2Fe-2S